MAVCLALVLPPSLRLDLKELVAPPGGGQGTSTEQWEGLVCVSMEPVQ